jgi:hypothetical protein
MWGNEWVKEFGGPNQVAKWGNPQDPRWEKFQAALEFYGVNNVDRLWWMPAFNSRTEASPTELDIQNAVSIYENLRRRLKRGAEIYVSGQPEHVPDGLCSATNTNGYLTSWSLAQQFFSHSGSNVLLGPALSPITEELTNDGCHQNAAGGAIHGQELKDFFE